MAKIFCNCSIEAGKNVSLKNGATKRLLLICNKMSTNIEANVPFNGKIGTLIKGNTSFIFINDEDKGRKDDRTLFILADDGYGIDFSQKEPIYYQTSTGGYGNSQSTIAILNYGTLIEFHSYKNRSESRFCFCGEKGYENQSLSDVYTVFEGDSIQEI